MIYGVRFALRYFEKVHHDRGDLSENMMALMLLLVAATPTVRAAFSVTLSTDLSSPVPVGYTLTWTATLTDSIADPVWYSVVRSIVTGRPRISACGRQSAS